MRVRPSHLGLAGLCLGALLMVTLRRAAPPPPHAPGELATVRVDFPGQPFTALFDAQNSDEGSDSVSVRFQDLGGERVAAKASLRGFSDWHHGPQKPSLRIKQKEPTAGRPGVPEFVELSRPEDPLALCNWLPDQLSHRLGLLHERSQAVHLWLDGRDLGVYLRSLRPGDDLAAASSRPRGTFWKGDSLGERQHLDLWSSRTAWRLAGAEDPRAIRALDELLAAVREPNSPEAWRRLARVFDLEAAARAAAIATLVGSIHADRAHNHVLFFDPGRDQLEPMLWDANGFGIHAEPEVPVEVARHPLAERLQADPHFVHRRNEVLWDLLHGDGSPTALIAAADARLHDLAPALRNDPEIARLVLRDGVFRLQPIGVDQLPTARAEFAEFVQRRHAALLAHFADARIAVEPAPEDPATALVTVFGSVAVRLSRLDGLPVQSVDRRDASLLWPGLTAESFPAPQHRAADGRGGVAAPHPRPAPLTYRLAVAPAQLRAHNAFTGLPVPLATVAPPPPAVRSLHPWSLPVPATTELRFGPGDLVLDADLEVTAGATLHLAAGTHLVLRPGVSIHCRGNLLAIGTADAPITIESTGGAATGVHCIGSADVHLVHVRFVDQAAWASSGGDPAPTLSLRGAKRARLESLQIEHASGNGLEVVNSRVQLRKCLVHTCAGTGLMATGGATVVAEALEVAFAQCGITARDGATVALHGGVLRGNVVGARADRSTRGFDGGSLWLAEVACRDNGLCDVDADAFGTVELLATPASRGALAKARVFERTARAPSSPR